MNNSHLIIRNRQTKQVFLSYPSFYAIFWHKMNIQGRSINVNKSKPHYCDRNHKPTYFRRKFSNREIPSIGPRPYPELFRTLKATIPSGTPQPEYSGGIKRHVLRSSVSRVPPAPATLPIWGGNSRPLTVYIDKTGGRKLRPHPKCRTKKEWVEMSWNQHAHTIQERSRIRRQFFRIFNILWRLVRIFEVGWVDPSVTRSYIMGHCVIQTTGWVGLGNDAFLRPNL